MARTKKEARSYWKYLQASSRSSRATKLQDLKYFERQNKPARLTRFDTADDDAPTIRSQNTPRTAHEISSYPLTLLPESSNSKAHKKTYCQRLVRNLDRFEEEPQIWLPELQSPTPPLLRLPPELRQRILELVLDDTTVLYPRPSRQTVNLSLICKTLSADMEPVTLLWDKRELEIRSGFLIDRSVVDDLLGPLKAASSVLQAQRTMKSLNSKRAKISTNKSEAKTRADQEAEEIQLWRSLRRREPEKTEAVETTRKRKREKRKKVVAAVATSTQDLKREQNRQKRAWKKEGKRRGRIARRELEEQQLNANIRKRYRAWTWENVVGAGIIRERNILRQAYGLGPSTPGLREEN